MPMKYQPDTIYIRHVPIRVIHKFTLFQVVCLALLWIVKSIKATSIAFAVMVIPPSLRALASAHPSIPIGFSWS